jgi:hypothetical protein
MNKYLSVAFEAVLLISVLAVFYFLAEIVEWMQWL